MVACLTSAAEWRSPPKIIALQDGQLDIWLLALDELPCEPAYLDTAETIRLNSFRYKLGRQQYCTSHTMTRAILGRYLNCAPQEVTLVISPGGKPKIDEHPLPLFFNLSHAGNTALLAVRTGNEVGIDIETVRDMPNTNGIAKRVFRKDDINQLEQAGGEMQKFFELWTHMEARQKCLGRGVFGEAAGEDMVETRSIELDAGQCAAIAWPPGTAPESIHFYRA